MDTQLSKQIVLLGLFSLLTVAFFGCVTAGTQTKVTSGQEGPSVQEARAEKYNGPKARIAVARFKDKTGGRWYNHRIGEGMADQLTTALFNSNRFIVLERQTLDSVLQEQDLGASGRIKEETAAPIGEIEGAEILVVAAVTEFQGNASGGGGSLGGFGGGVLGALAGGVKNAHMAIDLRLIDTKTSRILAATSVEGKATDVNLGGAMGGYFGGGALGGALGAYKNTPTGKAIRQCIQEAVDFIASRTPARYYHYGSGQPQSQQVSQPAATAAPSKAVDTGSNISAEQVFITPSALNMRSGPGTGNPVVKVLQKGDTLNVITRKNGWIKGQTASGNVGWVSGKYTAPVQ